MIEDNFAGSTGVCPKCRKTNIELHNFHDASLGMKFLYVITLGLLGEDELVDEICALRCGYEFKDVPIYRGGF